MQFNRFNEQLVLFIGPAPVGALTHERVFFVELLLVAFAFGGLAGRVDHFDVAARVDIRVDILSPNEDFRFGLRNLNSGPPGQRRRGFKAALQIV